MSYKTRLERIFQAPIQYCRPHAAGIIGLKVEFKDVTDLRDAFPSQTVPEIRSRFHTTTSLQPCNTHLKNLVDEVGVLDMINAVIKDDHNHLNLSGSGFLAERLGQDPFHRDIFWAITDIRFPTGFVTALHKPADCKRLTPTFYATAQSVQKVIRKLKRDGLSEIVTDALDDQAKSSYAFSDNIFDKDSKKILTEKLPGYAQRVFDLVPAVQKYKKIWSPGIDEVVIHSNKEGFLHGRPEGPDRTNNLKSFRIHHG